jgi:Colicin V production protein.
MNIYGFNLLDIIFAFILLSFMMSVMRKGLIQSLFGIFSFVISVLISSQFYPNVADFIKNKTFFYNWFNSMLKDTLNVSNLIRSQAENVQSGLQNNLLENVQSSAGISKELLDNIQLPSFVKDNFLSVNTSQIVKIFDMKTLENFISSHLANILVNILAMILTFTFVSIVMGIISHVLDIVSFLPFIHLANKLGGLVVGFVEGSIFLWVICMLFSLFVENPNFRFLKDALGSSKFAIKFYDSNLILRFLINFIPGFR